MIAFLHWLMGHTQMAQGNRGNEADRRKILVELSKVSSADYLDRSPKISRDRSFRSGSGRYKHI